MLLPQDAAQRASPPYHRSSLCIIDTEKGTADVFFYEAGFSAAAWLRE